MNKFKLIELIQKAINIGDAKLKNNLIYEYPLNMLRKMKQEVQNEKVQKVSQQLSVSLGQFNVRELEQHDMEYSNLISKINFEYDKFFDLIDKDFLDMIQGKN